MQMILLLIGSLCLLSGSSVTAAAATSGNNKIKVDVYYETLCPDSIRYLTSTVIPAMKTDLKSNIDLALYPYGKSTMESSGSDFTFNCHHGPDECYGNKIHACALKEITSMTTQLDLLNCLMSDKDHKKYEQAKLEPCFQKNGLTMADMDKIKMCANGTEGSKLLADYGMKTDKVQKPLKSVPFTVFNQNIDEEASTRAYNGNLVSIVCMHLPGENQPSACLNANGTAIGNHVPLFGSLTMATLLATGTFLTTATAAATINYL